MRSLAVSGFFSVVPNIKGNVTVKVWSKSRKLILVWFEMINLLPVITYIVTGSLFELSFFFFSSLLGQRKLFGKGEEPDTPERR